jgi:hypothetical protein
VLLATGRPAEALTAFQRGAAADYAKAGVARAQAALGRTDEARRIAAELERDARRRYVQPYTIALVYVSVGDRDAAFRWLDKAYEDRATQMVSLTTSRQWDPIRSDPRFQALVRRVGLRPLTS